MAAPVLVAYATRYGSTQEVAEAVAATLRDEGLEAEARPAAEVDTLESYGGVVMGAPFYIGHWPKDAGQFLSRHHEALAQRPVAIFSLGPLGEGEQEMAESRGQFGKELQKHPWLNPMALEMFVGKYDPARLSIFHKLLAILPASPLHGLPASDRRDWTAIRSWASGLAEKLGTV